MPHQCVRCSKLYADGAQEILKGCDCGARLFFYVKKKHLEESKSFITNLTDKDKKQMESDVVEISNIKVDEKRPVILDFESIRVLKPGKYELDLISLFKNDPLVFRLAEGKYLIDLPQAFKRDKE